MPSVHSGPYLSEPQSLLAECAMCKSEQPCHEGENSRMPIDQLKRLVWVLIVWVSLLTLCLGVSITLHFILPHLELSTKPGDSAGTGCNLVTYDYTGAFKLQYLEFETKDTNVISVKEDANYFIYLRLTLDSPTPATNYNISVIKSVGSEAEDKIMEGHINGSQSSALFMVKGLRLTAETVLKVACTPTAQLSTPNTYLGIIKLGPSEPCVPKS